MWEVEVERDLDQRRGQGGAKSRGRLAKNHRYVRRGQWLGMRGAVGGIIVSALVI